MPLDGALGDDGLDALLLGLSGAQRDQTSADHDRLEQRGQEEGPPARLPANERDREDDHDERNDGRNAERNVDDRGVEREREHCMAFLRRCEEQDGQRRHARPSGRTIRRSTYAARRVPSSWSCSRSRSSERWRTDARQALAGLGAAIERQFERWQLTDAERSVALLLLKGLSLEEIAAARGTSERTARQQSLAVYKKAGLGGRAELSAFFLEDLWLPSP